MPGVGTYDQHSVLINMKPSSRIQCNVSSLVGSSVGPHGDGNDVSCLNVPQWSSSETVRMTKQEWPMAVTNRGRHWACPKTNFNTLLARGDLAGDF